jgi:tRNA (guanine-N7-)-methyltransferase
MSRKKTQKITELKTLANVLQPQELQTIDPRILRDEGVNWQAVFKNNLPFVLELGCGSGVYTRELAKLFPEKNFIGVDTKGARLWQGAKIALAENLANVRFLRARVENLESYFALLPLAKGEAGPPAGEAGRGSVSEIWLTFPDPFPKKRQAKHRLTAPEFLTIYKKILAPGGVLHLKTDDLNLLNYSVETLADAGFCVVEVINNLYAMQKINPLLAIQTVYEKKHLAQGKQIHYLKAIK